MRAALQVPDRPGVRTQFLVRLVGGTAPIQNSGITGIALQRDTMNPERWHVLTKLRNYSQTPVNLVLALSLGGQVLERRPVTIAAAETTGVRTDLIVPQAGVLEAEIAPGDALPADNRAAVSIPAFHLVRVAVVSERSALFDQLRPVLATDPYIEAEFVRPGDKPTVAPDIVIHGGAPGAQPEPNAIWFVSGTPVKEAPAIRVAQWNSRRGDQWVRTRDVSVRNPATLQLNDVVLATAGSPEAPSCWRAANRQQVAHHRFHRDPPTSHNSRRSRCSWPGPSGG